MLILAIGLVIAVYGATILVNGASSIARRFNISELVIGATIIAFGTSCPELAVNIFSAIKGHTELAMSNIIGSNIFNILFILGIVGVIYPLRVKRAIYIKDMPMCILSAIVVFVCGNEILIDGLNFSKLIPSDGIIFLCFFCIFMYYMLAETKETIDEEDQIKDENEKNYSTFVAILLTVLGLGGLLFGGELIVDGAKGIAEHFGISDGIIGLAIVGPGTSVPELLASLVAAIKKKPNMAVGNIVGSNIFNVFFTLGLTAIIKPIPLTWEMNQAVLINIAASVLLFVFALGHRHTLGRKRGVIFLLAYAAYLTYMIAM